MFREITRAAILYFNYVGFINEWARGRCGGSAPSLHKFFLFMAAAEDPGVIVLDGREAPL